MNDSNIIELNIMVIEKACDMIMQSAANQFVADGEGTDCPTEEDSEKLTVRLGLWNGIAEKVELIKQECTDMRILLGMLTGTSN